VISSLTIISKVLPFPDISREVSLDFVSLASFIVVVSIVYLVYLVYLNLSVIL
jgi:hypothetical protein